MKSGLHTRGGAAPHQAPLPFDVRSGQPDIRTGQINTPADLSAPLTDQGRPLSDPSLTLVDRTEFVRNNRARRYVLRVQGDGSVRVTMPRWGSKREAQAFAAGQRAWVEAQRARIARLRTEREAALASQTPAARASLADAERSTRRRARHELPARLLQLAAELGLRVSKVSVRNQKWRWGSCSPSGHICLNWRLAAMPDWVRDYVLIHELMHLKRMDHSKKYWALVGAVCPSYKEARAWLRAHGEALR